MGACVRGPHAGPARGWSGSGAAREWPARRAAPPGPGRAGLRPRGCVDAPSTRPARPLSQAPGRGLPAREPVSGRASCCRPFRSGPAGLLSYYFSLVGRSEAARSEVIGVFSGGFAARAPAQKPRLLQGPRGVLSSAFAFLAVTRVAFAAEFGSSGCPRSASSGEDRLLPAELSSRVRPQTASPARPPWFCPSICSVHAAVLAVTTVSRDGPGLACSCFPRVSVGSRSCPSLKSSAAFTSAAVGAWRVRRGEMVTAASLTLWRGLRRPCSGEL